MFTLTSSGKKHTKKKTKISVHTLQELCIWVSGQTLQVVSIRKATENRYQFNVSYQTPGYQNIEALF
ncbi:hypothetical protein GDO86_019910 [Hymenochirus boettgeri]|uniref:Uncharacterized protein n=1 Tax=Hymenochirus boettgeri TaxID=247094 RepID=A0A8T2IED1_9PIPI|nr:hypothetical protein GDO86_019910 [Hymenochirus boettgeri]